MVRQDSSPLVYFKALCFYASVALPKPSKTPRRDPHWGLTTLRAGYHAMHSDATSSFLWLTHVRQLGAWTVFRLPLVTSDKNTEGGTRQTQRCDIARLDPLNPPAKIKNYVEGGNQSRCGRDNDGVYLTVRDPSRPVFSDRPFHLTILLSEH
jgi:hypothetical protein